MSVRIADGIATVRGRRDGWLGGAGFVLVGLIFFSYANAYVQLRGAGPIDVGHVVGLLTILVGLYWIFAVPAQLIIDPGRRRVSHNPGGVWRAPGTTVGFADVVSIGTDTLRDPQTGRGWLVIGVLRLTDDRHFDIHTVTDVDAIAAFAGFPVEHRTRWVVEATDATT